MSWGAVNAFWWMSLPVLGLVLFLFGFWARTRSDQRFGSAESIQALVDRFRYHHRATKIALLTTAMVLVVIALARPQLGTRAVLTKSHGIDLVIALDFSKSMLAQDIKPNRIDRAKLEVEDLLNRMHGHRIGAVAFAGETMEFPLTTDSKALNLFFRGLNPLDMPVGGTAIGRALTASRRLIERSETPQSAHADRVVLLVTDGEDHEGDPAKAAEELAQQNIKLLVVGVGSRLPEPIPSYSPRGDWVGYMRDENGAVVTTSLTADNEATLKRLATSTDGKYFNGNRGSTGLAKVTEYIASLKGIDRKPHKVIRGQDRFTWFLLPAILLLFLGNWWPEKKTAKRTATAVYHALILTTVFAAWLVVSGCDGQLLRSKNSAVEDGNALLEGQKAPDKALKAYEQAHHQLPNESAIQLNQALGLLDEKKWDEAIDKATKATENPSRTIRAAAYYHRGVAMFRKAEQAVENQEHGKASTLFSGAAEDFRKSLRAMPGQKNAAWNMELALRESQRQQEEQKQQDQEQKEKENQQQEDQQQGQDQPEEQEKQKEDENNQGADNKPEQNDKKPDQDQSSEKDKQSPASQKDKPLPANAEQILDALQQQEENFQKHKARVRGMQQRKPEKDW